MDATDFGAALRAAREDAGLSLKRASELIGVSHNALGGWELGKRRKRLPRSRVEQLEEAYGVTDRRLLKAGGYVVTTDAADLRRSLSYGGAALTAEEELQARMYIDFLRSHRTSG